MKDNYVQKKIESIILKIDYSWKAFVVSDFDEAVNVLKNSIDEINEIADYSIQNKLEVNLDSNKISYFLKEINACLENNQFVEAADIVKYKLLNNLQVGCGLNKNVSIN